MKKIVDQILKIMKQQLTKKLVKELIKQILIEEIENNQETEVVIKPSELAKKNICDSEKFCSAQGKITFGQLKAIVESATQKMQKMSGGGNGDGEVPVIDDITGMEFGDGDGDDIGQKVRLSKNAMEQLKKKYEFHTSS